MKPILRFALAAIFVCTFTLAAPAAEKPQATLDAITRLRADRLAEAKAAGKRADFTAISAEATAKAKASVKDVDPARVELGDAQPWYDLFVAAQDYNGARIVAQRWSGKAEGEERFKAQLALMSADYLLKDMKSLAQTLGETKPPDTAGAIRLANLANGYVLNALTQADKETAMKVLSAGEATVPKDGFSDDKQRDLAKRTSEQLARTRKVIEDNPGKEAEALAKERRSALAGLMAGRATGSNTNAAAAAAEARKARDAKLAELTGTDATDFKPRNVLGEFKGLEDLKGKVVMLDFFAHWCGPCKAALPTVRALYDELKPKGLQVVGVTKFYGYYSKENSAKRDMTPEKEFDRMKEFLVEKNINWPVAFVDKDVFEAYSCSAIPHVVVIDKTGKIRKIKVGYYPNEAGEFRKEIKKLLEG